MEMNALIWLVPLVLFAGVLVLKRLGQVSRDEAHRLVQSGARLIDVRSPAEFAGGNLPGSINVPVGELAARLEKLGARDEPKVVYCASGTRSALARSMLRSKGFTRVFNLGAMSRW